MSGYIRYSFAVDGERVAIDASTQPSGVISLQSGYPSGYSLPQANPLSKNIERTKFNELMYLVTTAIRILQQQGAPDFIEASENGGVAYSYSKYARCFRAGVCYESLVDNNTDAPPTANWKIIDDLASTTVRGLVEKATPTELLNAVANVWPDALTIANQFAFTETAQQVSLKIFGMVVKVGYSIYGELPAPPVNVTTTFASPFPTSCLFAFGVPYNPNLAGQAAFLFTTRGWTASQFTGVMQELAGSGDQFDAGYIWFAIGK